MSVEWKDGKSHRDPKWPVGGYAPGKYMGRCTKCDGRFINVDKRATRCFPCAIEDLVEANGHLSDKLRAAEAENETLRAVIKIVEPAHERP